MTPPKAMSNRVLSLYHLLMSLATITLGFLIIVYIAYAFNLMSFPFDYDQGEGFEVVDTILFSQGQLPYRDTEVYPFYSSNYPPLFHVIAVPFVWIFGGAYWYGRLLGFIGTLITASAIAYAVYRDGHQARWIALLSGLAFLASNFIYHIGPLVRQHMTMVMFETLAVVILAQAYPQKQKRRIALAIGLLICAGYTKQLAAITALALIAWMFLRNPRRAILWTFGFAFVGGLIFLWLNIASNGQWWIQAILANVNEFNPLQAFGLFVLWFKLHGFLLIPAGLMVAYELYFDRLSIYSLWFVVTALLGGIGTGGWGAGDSYLATSIAGMSTLSGIFLSRIAAKKWHFRDNYLKHIGNRIFPTIKFGNIILLIIPLLYLAYSRAVWHMPTDGLFQPIASILNIQPNVRNQFFDSATFNVPGYANIAYFITQEDIDAGYQIVNLMQETDKPILSEEAGFSLVAGRDVITNPTQLRNLYLSEIKSGRELFDGRELISMIENEEFGLVILRAQFYPDPLLQAIGQHYHLSETIDMNGFHYLIFRPLSESEEEG